MRPRLLPGRRQAGRHDARHRPADAAQRHARRRRRRAGPHPPAQPRLHELDPNAGSVTTMTHHTLTVGGFREKVDAAVALVEANGRADRLHPHPRGRRRARRGAHARGRRRRRPARQPVASRCASATCTGSPPARPQAVVATDVAARGIHVDDVDLVIHFDAASDAKAYLHRSGRTARAGRGGAVVTITTPKVDQVVRLSRRRRRGAPPRHPHGSAPMTAEALATSGSPAPRAAGAARRRPAGPAVATRAGATPAATGGELQGRAAAATRAAATSSGGRGGQAGSGRPKTVSCESAGRRRPLTRSRDEGAPGPGPGAPRRCGAGQRRPRSS